jgi:plasmid stabilization system protein ParE
VSQGRSRRERQAARLIIPFGSAGLIAAFEVRGEIVRIGAVRHQLEQDYQ